VAGFDEVGITENEEKDERGILHTQISITAFDAEWDDIMLLSRQPGYDKALNEWSGILARLAVWAMPRIDASVVAHHCSDVLNTYIDGEMVPARTAGCSVYVDALEDDTAGAAVSISVPPEDAARWRKRIERRLSELTR
jgi:hypothetical protein